MAARTHTYAQPRRSTHRATLAVFCGFAAAIAIPLGVELTHKVSGAALLDAAWAIPVAAAAAIASVMFARGEQASRLLTSARVLAITGICIALSCSIAVGIYEFLLWKEHHQ